MLFSSSCLGVSRAGLLSAVGMPLTLDKGDEQGENDADEAEQLSRLGVHADSLGELPVHHSARSSLKPCGRLGVHLADSTVRRGPHPL